MLKSLRPDPLPNKKKNHKKISWPNKIFCRKTIPVRAEMFTASICTSVPLWVLPLFFFYMHSIRYLFGFILFITNNFEISMRTNSLSIIISVRCSLEKCTRSSLDVFSRIHNHIRNQGDVCYASYYQATSSSCSSSHN